MRTLLFALALLVAAAPAYAASDGVRLAVPTRNIPRGDIIGPGDVTTAEFPGARALSGGLADPAELEGKQARRYLEAGQPVRAGDVRSPIVVTKGSTVTMTFTVPGIALTAIGKAMSEGGVGDTVTVLNPVSYRQVSAVVTGPGTVATGPVTMQAAQLAAANP